MDLGIIIAIVGSAIAIVGVLIATIFWTRGESNSVRMELSQDRKDVVTLMNQIRLEIRDEIHAIRLEMRDFHTRLCTIEERRREK
jgi:hypothetical protein